MFRVYFNRWLRAPLLTGRMALFCAMFAVGLPTLVRAAANGAVTGCEFTPYLPFVFICAVMLRWWQAAAVALGSVAILGGLMGHPPDIYVVNAMFPAERGNIPCRVGGDDRGRDAGATGGRDASKTR